MAKRIVGNKKSLSLPPASIDTTPTSIEDVDYERGGYVIIPLVSEEGDGSPVNICEYCMLGCATACYHDDTILEIDEGEFVSQACMGFILDENNMDSACEAGVALGEYDADCALRIYRHLYDPLSSPMDEAKSGIEALWDAYYCETGCLHGTNTSVEDKTDKKESHITLVKNKKTAIFIEGIGTETIAETEEEL